MRVINKCFIPVSGHHTYLKKIFYYSITPAIKNDYHSCNCVISQPFLSFSKFFKETKRLFRILDC